MRLIIYGTLSLLALILGIDTHIGSGLATSESSAVADMIAVLDDSGLRSDAHMARSVLRSSRFRKSRFFDWLNAFSEARGYDFAFYAYTPILSSRRVFLGDNYWRQDAYGRASVTVHELAHVRRHERRAMRGIPRSSDEVEAYRYQYQTYRAIGIGSYGIGSDVYWDMMYGIRDYVVPAYPEYAERKDVAEALYVMRLAE